MRSEAGRYLLLNQQKYDLTYQNSIAAVVLGNIIIMLHVIAFLFFNPAQYQYLILSIPLRIIIPIWAVITAGRQNRNRAGWFFCSIILPALSLILLGSIKKLRIQVKVDQAADEAQQYKELTEIARKLADRYKYQESVDVYNYIVAKLPYEEHDVKMKEQLLEQLADHKRKSNRTLFFPF